MKADTMTRALTFSIAARVMMMARQRVAVLAFLIGSSSHSKLTMLHALKHAFVLLSKLWMVDCHPGIPHLLWTCLHFSRLMQILKTGKTLWKDNCAKNCVSVSFIALTFLRIIFHPAKILLICWENHFRGDVTNLYTVTVDRTTNCIICEPKPFNRKCVSHKFRKAGLWYELAVFIKMGNITWTNGPFPCRRWPNFKIFWKNSIHHCDNKRSKGHRGWRCDNVT